MNFYRCSLHNCKYALFVQTAVAHHTGYLFIVLDIFSAGSFSLETKLRTFCIFALTFT
jgi:hypothetical protein